VSSIDTLVERTTLFVTLAKMKDAAADAAMTAFGSVLNRIDAQHRLSMTYDQGREMAQHERLSEITGVAAYFADPHSPWQRGINENTNGLLCQYFPKGSDLSGFSQAELDTVAWQLNTRPRKSLNFRCPAELFMPDAFDFYKGFSLDAGVRIEGNDRQGLERLLRYCARPAFALERLRQIDAEHLVYESTKPGPGGSVSLILTPMELLDRLAALIPPPRRHRHRYFGVLAPNSPQREAVTALAAKIETAADIPQAAGSLAGESLVCQAARYAWALLLARIYEVLPLVCPKCGGEMRIIAFIIEAQVVRQILTHLGVPTSSPRMVPARGPPLWEAVMERQSTNDLVAQPEPAYEFDQRIAW